MNKQVVVYTSETGFTQKYAMWIAEELGCEAINMKEWMRRKPSDYQTVIYGGGFYAGQIKGLKKMKNCLKQYPGIRLIVFGTGATPPEEKEMVKAAMDGNFTDEERGKIPAFYFQSGLNYENMSLKYKLMMKAFISMLKKKTDLTKEEKVMMGMLAHSYDFCKKENIRELINYSENGVQKGLTPL